MRKLIIIMVLAGLAACSTVKEWTATGGSRADGIVRLSYQHSNMEIPKIEIQEGVALAAKRCAVWGYTDAEPFGGTTKVCSAPAGFGGCNMWQVTAEYQCIGDLEL
ncbi:MAG: YecR family lipoprotein [Pseudomonadota bacterium]